MMEKKRVLALICLLIISIIIPVLADSAPKLFDGGAQPPFGKPGITVSYRVKYLDSAGNAPAYVKVCFPQECKEMKKISGDFKTGAVYEFIQLQYESWEFHFEASDGEIELRYPDYEGSGLSPVNILTEIPENNKVIFFAKESSKPLWEYSTGKDWVLTSDMSKDGKYIVIRTTDLIYLFSKDSNVPLWKHQCTAETGENNNPAGWAAISSGGDYIAGACANGLLLFSKQGKVLWKYESGKTKQGSIYSLSMSDDGKHIALGTMNSNMLYLFSKDSNEPLWEYEAKGDVHGLAVSPRGNYIAAGSHCPDRRAYLFTKSSNVPVISYVSSEDSPVWAADVADNGIAAYGLDGAGTRGFQSNLFLMSPGNNTPFMDYFLPGWVRSVGMSENAEYIAVGCGGGYVYLIDKDSSTELWKYNIGKRVGDVAISKDGNYIAAGSKDKKVYLFSREKNEPLWSYDAGEWVNTVSISSDGNYLIAGTGAMQYLAEGQHTAAEETQMTPICGDTVCVGGENSENCPQDCKGPSPKSPPAKKAVCGDGTCDYELEHCPQDCAAERERHLSQKPGQAVCGDGVCDYPETEDSCPGDCCGEDCKEKKGLFQWIFDFFKQVFGYE